MSQSTKKTEPVVAKMPPGLEEQIPRSVSLTERHKMQNASDLRAISFGQLFRVAEASGAGDTEMQSRSTSHETAPSPLERFLITVSWFDRCEDNVGVWTGSIEAETIDEVHALVRKVWGDKARLSRMFYELFLGEYDEEAKLIGKPGRAAVETFEIACTVVSYPRAEAFSSLACRGLGDSPMGPISNAAAPSNRRAVLQSKESE